MTNRSTALVLVAFLAQSGAVSAQDTPSVATGQGRLHGATESGVDVYRGVPFAAPPVGELRWRPPEPPSSWQGVRSAEAFAPGCMQSLTHSRLPWTESFMHHGAIDEDCLYLNIWTASGSSDGPSPVLVYFHGGGFSEGSGSVPIYDGAALARRGLVVVTANYRLGVLGFLTHPDLTRESLEQASGNYGLLDQIAALAWVRDNIDAFGGDPSNVTIAGQSAGAMSVYLLTASPLADGLFHRAISQSGPGALASFGIPSLAGMAPELQDSEEAGLDFATRFGAESVAELRELPAGALLTPPGDGPPVRFRPVVDGWSLPEDLGRIYAEGRQHDVPMLAGMNADEGSAFPGYGQRDLATFETEVRERFGDAADTYLALYSAGTDDQAAAAAVQSTRDLALVAMASLAAERAATAETPAYLYYFARAIPWPAHPEFGAFHTGEVPYVFDNLDQLARPWQRLDLELADRVAAYWANFARTGDPNGAGLPEWPVFDAAREFMVFGEGTGAKSLPAPEVVDFFEGL